MFINLPRRIVPKVKNARYKNLLGLKLFRVFSSKTGPNSEHLEHKLDQESTPLGKEYSNFETSFLEDGIQPLNEGSYLSSVQSKGTKNLDDENF